MPKYQRAVTELDDDNEIDLTQEETAIPENLSPEEATYAKRYADLRRHTAKLDADNKRRIAELESSVRDSAQAAFDLPGTDDDVDDWISKYPEIAGVVARLADRRVNAATEDLQKRVAELSDDKVTLTKTAAQEKLREEHPDFFTELRSDPEFHTWLEGRSQLMQDAIYVNETDWQAAADVISVYKTTKGIRSTAKPQARGDAARDVNVRSKSEPARSGMRYSESQISKMSPQEFDKNEEAIEAALREGKVLMDLSGGAR